MNNSSDSVVDGTPHRVSKRHMSKAGTTSARTAGTELANEASNLLSLTARANELQALKPGLSKSPAFDTARVGELKEAISRGLYAVNATRIAEKLLAVESKLP